MIWTIQKILKKLKKVMMKITSLLYFWLEIKTSWEQIKLNVLCFLHFSKRPSTFFRFSLRVTTLVPHFFYMFLNVFPVFPKNYSMCSSTSKNFPQRLGFSSTSKIDVPKNSSVPQRLRRWGCSSTSVDHNKSIKLKWLRVYSRFYGNQPQKAAKIAVHLLAIRGNSSWMILR